MSFKTPIVSILLSLILGLSTTVSVAHSHLYHDHELSHVNHGYIEKHTDDCHQSDLHKQDGHNESDCVFTVVQYTDSLPTQLIPADSGQSTSSKKTVVFTDAPIHHPINGFLARAPPFSL